jgi:hypothetical protein
MSYSAAKMSFGVFGSAAAAAQGKEIIEQNGIENSFASVWFAAVR